MYLYDRGTWSTGYLDASVPEGMIRLTVQRQVALAAVDEQFFVRSGQIPMVVAYVRRLGPRRVWRKIISRRSESSRNDAWLSIGIGCTDHGGVMAFVATGGPRASERVVVHRRLCFEIHQTNEMPAEHPEHFQPRPGSQPWAAVDEALAAALQNLAGWSPYQGVDASLQADARDALVKLVCAPRSDEWVALEPPPGGSPLAERRLAAPGSSGSQRPPFHLFGYGQYAKTQVIANLGRHLELSCVHEIDPLQIGPITDSGPHGWDTSPVPRADEVVVNAAVAGYHHTHAPLAVELLDRGVGHVILEKPIATSSAQLDELVAAMARNPKGRVHVAFQRRYSPFNQALLHDLDGPPVSMAATVFEVPLPARHWYRWKIVGNEVVSNGCHWIDHFLFLNEFAPVTSLSARRLSSQIILGIELENGASASISLRHEGSPRVGVRDHCVFWKGDVTVTIDDLTFYRSEQGFGGVRKRRAHPYRSLEDMYALFGRRVLDDAPGDDPAALRSSAEVTLELARLVDES